MAFWNIAKFLKILLEQVCEIYLVAYPQGAIGTF